MLPEQKDLIYKHFPQLVHECNLETVAEYLVKKCNLNADFLDEVSSEQDRMHKNRLILFKLLSLENFNAFPGLVEALKESNLTHLAKVLENKLEAIIENNNLHPLHVDLNVKLSTQFYDTEQYNKTGFYTTRAKNRGHVLLITNIKFSQGHDERHGAAVDEKNLREMFTKMGLRVFSYTNLSAHDMYHKTVEFSNFTSPTAPDMAIVIIMSHGMVINNETVIVGSDNKCIPEDTFRVIFNNENCPQFRHKPKIFIYHVCRCVFTEPVTMTETDAISNDAKRTYSDMLVCHPSVKGYSAHRNSIKGSWYIQLLCKVFMNHAHDMDIESLLRKVDEELEVVSSMPSWVLNEDVDSTQQTSTFKNIAFKKCYLHPGVYEENGHVVKIT